MCSKEGGDAGQKIVVAIFIGPEDHITIVVALQIGDLAQQGDGVVASSEAFDLLCGSDGILFDLVALGGIKRHVRLP